MSIVFVGVAGHEVGRGGIECHVTAVARYRGPCAIPIAEGAVEPGGGQSGYVPAQVPDEDIEGGVGVAGPRFSISNAIIVACAARAREL
jgi:hypothetical protein